MSYEDIIRAWKDEDYRMSLSEEERAQLPENPAGLIELTDGEMGLVGGGYGDDEGDGGDGDNDYAGTIDQKNSKVACTPYCRTHIYDSTCSVFC